MFFKMTQSLLKYAVGIDVSKDKFDVCMSVIDTHQKVTIKATRSFANNPKGFKELATWVVSHQKDKEISLVYLMEATGVYYENLAWFLFNVGASISVILPKKAKHYFKSLGLKSKNDKIDAKGLAQMACQQDLLKWKPISPQIEQLRALTRYYNNLQEQKTVFNNQIHALEHSHYPSDKVLKGLRELIKLLEKQLKQIKEDIAEVIEKDTNLKAKFDLISPIEGVGLITITTIIAETNGFELFENQRQLTSYAGYDVTERQSGKMVGRRAISKQGNSRIRKVLHLPAFNVVRFQQKPFETLYKRVAERTQMKMKGYVAVQRKLLVLMYTLWKNNEPYNPNKVASTGEATLNETDNRVLLS